MDLKATMTGGQEAAGEMRRRGKSLKRNVSAAVTAGLKRILKRAKEIVPLDEGPLRASGRIEKTLNAPEGEVLFGGDDAPYAFIQHEVPPPPEKSPSGLSFTHDPPRTYKYLERAADENTEAAHKLIYDASEGALNGHVGTIVEVEE